MNFLAILKTEFTKTKRSKIVPLIFVAPLLVVISGVANISSYFTPEYEHAWAAMFIQSALLYAYYLLPLSMAVVCVVIAARETQNNGILKMLALPVSRATLSAAKFCVLMFYLLLEVLVFFVVFVAAGIIATQTAGISETLPILELLDWSIGLFLTMLPCAAFMWLLTVLFEKPLLSISLNLLFIIPGILAANTSFWVIYPYCYSGFMVSQSMSWDSFPLFPFIPCAIVIFAISIFISIIRYGKNKMQ